MLVDEWVSKVWTILQVRPRTLHDYQRLYRRHLQPLIGGLKINDVLTSELQIKLLSMPRQTARPATVI